MIRALRRLPKTVWLLGAISLFNDAASDMIYPLVPLYLTAVLLAGPRALGLIEGVAEAASSLLKLTAGVLSDRRHGTRGWVIGGYTVTGFVRPMLALTRGWPGVLACRLGDRLGKGLRSAPRDAMISACIGADQRGLAFGFHRAMDNLGAVIGPLIAAGLLTLGWSLRGIFLWSIVPAVIVIALTLVLKEPRIATTPVRVYPRWAFRDLPVPFRRYLVALGLFTLGNSSNMFLLLRAQSLGAGAERIVLMWALFSAVAAALSVPLSALSDRLGRFRVLGAAWGAYALAYLAIGLMPQADWAMWLAFAGYGAVTAALEGTEKALVADLVGTERGGTAFGWYNLVSGVTLLPASVLFGWLWHAQAALLAFGFGAACAGLATVLLLTWVCHART